MPSSPSWKTPNVTGGNSSRWRGPRANDFNSGSDAVAVSGPAAPRSTFKDHRPKYSRAMNQPSLGPSSRCKAVHGTHCAVAAPSSLRLYGTATGDCSNLPWLGPALHRKSRIACRTGRCRRADANTLTPAMRAERAGRRSSPVPPIAARSAFQETPTHGSRRGSSRAARQSRVARLAGRPCSPRSP